MFGWKGDALQRAMDKSECFYDGCGSITKQAMSVANKCTVKDAVGEQTDGCKLHPPPQLRHQVVALCVKCGLANVLQGCRLFRA